MKLWVLNSPMWSSMYRTYPHILVRTGSREGRTAAAKITRVHRVYQAKTPFSMYYLQYQPKICLLPHFSHCPLSSLDCAVKHSIIFIFFSSMVNANVVTGAPFKILRDLSKKTAEVNNLMLAILRAVERVGVHTATGCKLSVSFLSHFWHCYFCFVLFYSAAMGASNESLIPTRSSMRAV